MLKIDSGLHRAGVLPDDAPAMARELVRLSGIQFRGILTHEGHVSMMGDRQQLERAAVGVGDLIELAATLAEQGTPAEIVSVGATASALLATRPGVTEVRAGMYAFNDASQVNVGTVGIERCAARVVATVVSHAAPDADRSSTRVPRPLAWTGSRPGRRASRGLAGLVMGPARAGTCSACPRSTAGCAG